MPLPNAKDAANALAAQAHADILLIAERIADGESIASVKADFKRAIVRQIVAQSALGRGSWQKVDKERAGRLAAIQFDFMDKFLRDAYKGKIAASRIAQRAAMYAEASRSVYENERIEAQRDEGFTLAARILSASDHCPGCVDAAAAGFVPIDEVLPIGEADCLGRCNCTIIYKRNENSPTAPAAQRAIEAAQVKAKAYADIKAAKEETE